MNILLRCLTGMILIASLSGAPPVAAQSSADAPVFKDKNLEKAVARELSSPAATATDDA